MSVGFSQLHEEKLKHMFRLLDVDGNGSIEYDDFRMVVDTLAEERDWNKKDRRYLGLVTANKRLWKMYSKHFDRDGDGAVSIEEWIEFHRHAFVTEPLRNGFSPEVSEALKTTAQFLTDMLDSDLDGKVTEDDYVFFCKAYNIDDQEARRGFRLFDRNNNGVLQREEVVMLIEEFYLSEDPLALGNVFFGNL